MAPSTSSIDKTEVKATISETDVDVGAQFTAGKDIVVDPAEATRIRRKIDLHLLPLMCILYMMQFADKATLGQSAVLKLLSDTHISQSQFNWLGTAFYLFFLVFEYPQNLALQRFPVGKWMSINIFVWAVALMCHAASTNFAGLLVCRIFLGICEGAITPGFMIVTSMFYTREEQTKRVGYWFLMNGTAIIMLGLVAYGTLHINTGHFHAWQWLMIIMGLITFIVSILFWFFFPDSPANAKFLTPEERITAIARIKVNQAGVENKTFKKDQMIECLLDPKTWLWFLFSALSNVTNSLANQRQLIVAQFGFNPIQTTLIGCVDGVVEIITIYLVVTSAAYWKNARAYTGVGAYAIAILGAILVNTLPSSNKIGLLFSYWVAIIFISPFVIVLAWVGSTTAGHTKRITTNAIVMIGFAVGNAAGPQFWEAKYQPRNHVPWTIMTVCWFVSAVLLLLIRWYLANENVKRDREPHDATYDDIFVTRASKDGEGSTVYQVDKAFLDLTDIQNREFRYVL